VNNGENETKAKRKDKKEDADKWKQEDL